MKKIEMDDIVAVFYEFDKERVIGIVYFIDNGLLYTVNDHGPISVPSSFGSAKAVEELLHYNPSWLTKSYREAEEYLEQPEETQRS